MATKVSNQSLRCGERNPSFFHCSTIQHKRHNKILGLKSKYGSIGHTHKDISNKLNEYFRKLLEDPRVDITQEIKEITHNVPTILNQDHNKMILRDVSIQEVEEVVMSMPNGKALDNQQNCFKIS